MTEIVRGQKVKLVDFTESLELKVDITIESTMEIDIACFCLDGNRQLYEDDYMIFFNQLNSPNQAIKLLSHRSGLGKFSINLSKIPPTIQNVVFTASTNGNGAMAAITAGSVVISSGGIPILIYKLNPSDFKTEESLILTEIYYKDNWKVAAVGQGFTGGLETLVRHFGGTLDDEQSPDDMNLEALLAEEVDYHSTKPINDEEPSYLEEELPIYALDIEARLLIDTFDFESQDSKLGYLERESFLLFKKLLEDSLENEVINENDLSMSLEHLKFNRYISALVSVIEKMENELEAHHQLEVDDDIEKLKLYVTTLCIACYYRYPYGLYNSKSSLYDYISNKVEAFPKFKEYFLIQFKLKTLCPASHLYYKHPFRIESLTDYFDKPIEFSLDEEGSRYLAYRSIRQLFYTITLETNTDWSFPEERKFSYWEIKVITEDLLSNLRKELRKAYLEKNESQIKTTVYAINLASNYFIGINGGTAVNAEDIPFETQLYSDYLNINLIGASMYNTSFEYAKDVRILGTRGHGVAAERANHIIDRIRGLDAEPLGDDNAPSGPDRRVGNQIIQTKYCKTGGDCIRECFDNGKFRYEVNGKPMAIEVPKDKYDDAVKSLQDRIRRGDMQNLGITDPEAAKEIVKKGSISYKTAQRIAKAGTVEGLLYDSSTGVIQASQAFGISVSISFAQSIWRGEEIEEAISDAISSGTKVFGASLAQHIATKQLGRTAVEKSLRPMTDLFTKKVIGSKASAKIVNTFVRSSGQKAISGAAATNQLSKFMRGNIVTGVVTTAIMSSGHIYDAIEGRISGKQLFKNISTAGAGVGGAAIGATVGSVVPVVGTIVGGFVGGWIGGKVSKTVLDKVIEDDAIGTYEILKDVFVASIEELQLDREELNFIMDYVFDQKQLPKNLKLIYAAETKEDYIENMIDPYIEALLKARPRVSKNLYMEAM